MKTLIIYTSKHGSTHKIATYIKDKLQAESVNLLENVCPDLSNYDQLVIGGSIYYKAIDPKLSEFIESNLSTLLSKKIALFLVCLLSEESAAEQFNNNFDETLLNHSSADGFFGGVLEPTELNPLEKLVTSFAFKNVNVHENLFFDEADKFTQAISTEAKE